MRQLKQIPLKLWLVLLPVIEVKSSDDLTTSVIRFAVSTLQTDIQAIANGTASAETVTSYTEDLLNYIAEDQSIDSGEIAPDINAIADSATTSEDTAVEINVLLNDSYLSLSTHQRNRWKRLLTEPPALLAMLLLMFLMLISTVLTPFSYTITQGDKTSSAEVTVTINAVNDAPSINIASAIQLQLKIKPLLQLFQSQMQMKMS